MRQLGATNVSTIAYAFTFDLTAMRQLYLPDLVERDENLVNNLLASKRLLNEQGVLSETQVEQILQSDWAVEGITQGTVHYPFYLTPTTICVQAPLEYSYGAIWVEVAFEG